jgi:hypothetical protein
LSGAANTSSASNLVSVDMSMVRDAAGNAGSGVTSASASYAVDTVAPSAATITLDGGALTSGHGIGFTVTFAEAVTLDASAFTTPHASISGLTPVDGGRTWAGTLSTTETGTSSGNTVALDMSKVFDLAGNHGSGSVASTASYTVNADTTAPGVVSFGIIPVIGAGSDGIFTITFSEAVQSLDPSAFSAPHLAISNLQTVDHISWIGKVSPASDTVGNHDVLTIDLGKIRDMAGNSGSGTATSNSYDVDTRAPTVAISADGSTLTDTHPIVVTLAFSEVVVFDASALSAQHATVASLTSTDGITYKATLVPFGSGSFTGNTLSLDMSKVHDIAGNAGAGTATSPSYAVDTTHLGASIALDSTLLKAGSDIGVTITFSSPVSELGVDALIAGHAKVTSLQKVGDGLAWHATLTADDSVHISGNVLTLDLTKVHDTTGHLGTASVSSTAYEVDTRVSAYVSDLFINDTGISETDGVTYAEHQDVSGYIVGTIGEHQHLEVKINGQTIDPSSIETVHEGNLLFWSYYPSSETANFNEGTNTVSARLVDDTGIASAAVSKTFTVDTVAPSVATSPAGAEAFALASPIVITFDEAVYWSPGEAIRPPVELYDSHGHTIGIAASDVSFSADHKTLTIAASKHQLVTGNDYGLYLNDITDQAGNWLNEYSIHFKTEGVYVDTTAPRALKTIVSGGGHYHAGETLELRVRFDENVHVVGAAPALELTNGKTAVLQPSAEASSELVFTYTVAPGDDTSDLRVKNAASLVSHVADGAGNLLDAVHIEYDNLYDSAGYGAWVEIDTVVPSALGTPHLDSDSGASATDKITSTASPQFSGSGAEHGVEIRLYEGSTLVGGGYSDEYGNWTASVWDWRPLADGIHNISVSQVDFADNESPASTALAVTIDTARPAALAAPKLAAESDSGAFDNDGITSVAKPKFTGTGAEPGATITLYANEIEVGHATSDASGAWTVAVANDLVDKVYSFAVKQTDLAGNLSFLSPTTQVTIDRTAPLVTNAYPNKIGGLSYSFEFNERVVFAPDGQFTATHVVDALMLAPYVSGGTNWSITDGPHGVQNMVNFNIGQTGLIHMQAKAGSIVDLAGNAAIIGSPDLDFTIPLLA